MQDSWILLIRIDRSSYTASRDINSPKPKIPKVEDRRSPTILRPMQLQVRQKTHNSRVIQRLLIHKRHHIRNQHDGKNPKSPLTLLHSHKPHPKHTYRKSIFLTSLFSASAENRGIDSSSITPLSKLVFTASRSPPTLCSFFSVVKSAILLKKGRQYSGEYQHAHILP